MQIYIDTFNNLITYGNVCESIFTSEKISKSIKYISKSSHHLQFDKCQIDIEQRNIDCNLLWKKGSSIECCMMLLTFTLRGQTTQFQSTIGAHLSAIRRSTFRRQKYVNYMHQQGYSREGPSVCNLDFFSYKVAVSGVQIHLTIVLVQKPVMYMELILILIYDIANQTYF